MRRVLWAFSSGIMLLIGVGLVQAKEMKFAYVDSERILESSEDYKTARQKLQDEERDYMTQAQNLEKVVKQMDEELASQSLMLSPEAKKEREQRLLSKQTELLSFRKDVWGEGGKLYARNLELSRPILDKINEKIKKISQDEGYDFVFDAATAGIVYALPEHDITDKIIDELKKE
jgi:outer membrane protein